MANPLEYYEIDYKKATLWPYWLDSAPSFSLDGTERAGQDPGGRSCSAPVMVPNLYHILILFNVFCKPKLQSTPVTGVCFGACGR